MNSPCTLLVFGIWLWTNIECAAQFEEDSADVRSTETCLKEGVPKLSESLLQRVSSYRDERVSISTESSAAPCAGFYGQGRCWYLSDFGQSCATTCSKNGAAFSFVLADAKDPILPKLLKWNGTSNSPSEPFAPLECLEHDAMHFHAASAEAFARFIGDLSAWRHDACQLACPCGDVGQCEWKQPSGCTPEFEWKGTMYTGCPTVDHDGPWCMNQQHGDADKADDSDWSYCYYSCATKNENVKLDAGCFWKPAASCVAEFDYEDSRYFGCTTAGNHTPWCSNSDPYSGYWNDCEYVCLENTTNDNVNETEVEDDQVCYWQPDSKCASSFKYKGVDYNGCTTEDHPTPWCSHDRIHHDSWSLCVRVCTRASNTSTSAIPVSTNTPAAISSSAPSYTPPASSVAVATTPKPMAAAITTPIPVDHSALNPDDSWQGEPCDRHPESENDYIGLEATLDEEGYQICTLADSPLSMKRFICRVVDKIGCKVVDYSSLVGFVPYYSGAVAEQTYGHLEDELKILCHAGGKWLIPLTPD